MKTNLLYRKLQLSTCLQAPPSKNHFRFLPSHKSHSFFLLLLEKVSEGQMRSGRGLKLAGLLLLIVSSIFGQASYTLNTPDAVSKVYTARDYVRFVPGYSFSALTNSTTLKANINNRILIDAAYQTGTAIPTADRTLNTSYAVGTTSGSADVSPTGAATYQIPIAVPVGTGGIQPTLSVSYNSQSGSGLLGYGWNLGGISAISRTGSTIYHNGKTEGVQLTNDDNLTLDGQRLILTNGTNLTAGADYHTEIENCNVVTMKTINGLLCFEVKTKDGTLLEFGSSADSYIEAQGSAVALYWVLTKVTDVNGNYMTYSYEEDNANGDFRLKRIDYTGNLATGLSPYNSVEFFYETRSDRQTSYVAGTKSFQSVLLKRIKTMTNGLTAHEYRFNYTIEGFYSKLTEVEEYGSDGSRYNSTIITADQLASESINSCTQQGWIRPNYICEYEDFNNDGKTDMLFYPNKAVYPNRDLAIIRFYDDYWKSTTETTCYLPSGFDKILIGDFNGDGYKDILCISTSKTNTSVYNYDIFYFGVKNFLYDYSKGQIKQSHFTADSENALCGDFNGDGKCEIMIKSTTSEDCETDDTGYYYCHDYEISQVYKLSEDNITFKLCGYDKSDSKGIRFSYTMNFNGNNKTDVFMLSDIWWFICELSGEPTQDGLPSWKILNSGLNFVNIAADPNMTKNHFYFGDFNGDGLTDLLKHGSDAGAMCGDSLLISNGKTFEPAISLPMLTKYHSQLLIGDFNGDGKSDIGAFVVPDANNEYFTDLREANNRTFYMHYLLSDGQGGLIRSIEQGDANTDFYHTIYYDNLGIGDFSEKGRATIVFLCYPKPYPNEGQSCLWGNYAHKSNYCYLRVKSIVDGLNNSITFTYKTLSKPLFCTTTDTYNYPLQTLRMASFAVDSLTYNVGSDVSTTTYLYKNLKIHMQGKGILGFDEVTVANKSQNKKITTQYGYDPTFFTTYPTQQTVTTADGNPISTTTYTNDLYSLGGKRIFPYLSAQTTTDNLTGLSASESFVYNASDDGNLSSSTHIKGSLVTAIGYTYDKFNSIFKNRAIQTTTTQSGLIGTYTSTNSYGYDTSGRLINKTLFLGDAKAVSTSYGYDGFGNVNTTATSATGLPAATASATFDATGRFAETQTDAAGLSVARHYNALGRLEYQDMPDGQHTAYGYNGFGEAVAVTPPTGKTITTATNWDGSGTGLYYIQTTQEGSPATTVWYDALAREVKRQTTGFNGAAVTFTKSYNAKGELKYVTLPYYSGETPRSVNYGYDAYGRFQSRTFNYQTSWYIYNGLSTTVTRPDGNTSTTTLNSSGLVESKTEPLGNSITYSYNSLGKPVTITANGAVTTIGYDNRGYQNSLADPNMNGNMGYDYNAYGQLATQTTPNGATTSILYDAAGRLQTKTTPEAVYGYQYYNATEKGAGLLKSIKQDGTQVRLYEYTDLGQLTKQTDTFDGNPYATACGYDAYNRLSSTTSPSGLVVSREYDTNGYLQRLRDKTTNNILWQANVVNALGKVTESMQANGLIRTTGYDSYEMPQYIQLKNGSTLVDDIGYTFDGVTGNLSQRNDNTNSRNETFGYDDLNRLTSSTLNGLSIHYNTDGSIQNKSDVGDYSYNGNQAVNLIRNHVDPTFEQTQGQILYTSDNRVSHLIQQAGTTTHTLDFGYNPDGQRYKTVLSGNGSTTTHYYFGNYEKESTGGATKEFDYIYSPEGMASIAVSAGGTRSFYAVNTDHLGSIRMLTDANKSIVSQYWYDAWGNRTRTYGSSDITNRGYTAQEHLNEFGLINLNARLYDPKLGQFLGLDQFVQDPSCAQNFNRYSYCMNNPLLYTDPSGNSLLGWLKKTFWDTPWSWINGTDKGHPNVYSGGLSQKLNDWGIPSFGAGYNTSQGFFYNVGNNPRVYPGQEAALQKQFAALHEQTQAMIVAERQQRGTDMAWQNWVQMMNMSRVGKTASSDDDSSTYFEGARVYATTVGDCKSGAAFTVPGIGIFVNPRDVNNVDKLRHEFGHILQYEKWGAFFYWTQIVPTSVSSAKTYYEPDHMQTWTEWSADRLSYNYFGQPANWNKLTYPIFPSANGLRIGGNGPSFPSNMDVNEFLFDYLYK